MKQEIHPNYQEINVTCACGHSFNRHLRLQHDLVFAGRQVRDADRRDAVLDAVDADFRARRF